jgi:hypothetical protein
MTDEQPSPDAVSLSTVFDALGHGSRRLILLELADHTPQTEAEFETEELAADGGNSDWLEAELNHTHLPKLADSGFIDWNPKTDTITRGPRFDEIEPLLTLIDTHRDELPSDWP